MPLSAQIEGVLFFRASPVSRESLRVFFQITELELADALNELHTTLQGRGINLVETDKKLQLMTAPALADCIEALQKEDSSSDIGKAGAETLAIVLYREPVTKAEIEQIRGVNSSYILRNLQTRGLIARTKTKLGQSFTITPELLAHLGVSNKQQLVDFAEVMDKLDTVAAADET